MRTIYVDSSCCCHISDDGTRMAIETDVFDGKSDIFVEGYRLVPAGQTWIREDGEVFTGEMIAPWKDSGVLASYQQQYEEIMMELEAAYREGVNSI